MNSILAATTLFAGLAFAGTSTSFDDGQCGSTCGATKARAALASNPAADDIVATAVGNEDFSTLVRLVSAADLVETLQGEGPFTVFAPNNAAFTKLLGAKGNEKLLETLLDKKNKAMLQGILTYHVVPGKVMAKDVVKLKSAGTANGQRVDVAVEEGTVMIDGAKVIAADIECSNGVIHVIDSVILPEQKSIVGVAAGAKTFGTLLAAAKAAGLAEALDTKGPFTVFAPTDAAFAALPKGTVENLLKAENKDRLVAILKHHVVEGRVFADQAAKLESAKTIGGSTLPLAITREQAKAGNANIVATDIEAANGVIHVVDAVILP